MKHLQNLGKTLSRDAMKLVLGGDANQLAPFSDGFSCECKDGHSAGMTSCTTCERYCSTDNSYGGQKSCD